MREHYISHYLSKDTPPATGGDMESWLRYYKLNPENGETYIPVMKDYSEAQPGDVLWFSLDGRLLAGVEILRVQHDPMNARHEIWYNAEHLRFCATDLPFVVNDGVMVRNSKGESWWKMSLERRTEAREGC
jgi:hypothetical protein